MPIPGLCKHVQASASLLKVSGVSLVQQGLSLTVPVIVVYMLAGDGIILFYFATSKDLYKV